MNAIDIVFGLLMIWALWAGFREGFVVQLGGLLALAAGIWLAFRYGTHVGTILRLEGTTASVAGFIAVLIAVLIVLAILGRLLRGLFRLTGLGVFDSLLGALLSAAKVAFVGSLLILAFDSLNADYSLLDRRHIETSRVYGPLRNFSEQLFPYFDEAKRRIAREFSGAEPAPEQNPA